MLELRIVKRKSWILRAAGSPKKDGLVPGFLTLNYKFILIKLYPNLMKVLVKDA